MTTVSVVDRHAEHVARIARPVHSQAMTTVGMVRRWDDEEGWGVIDSPETPGGCWAHYSNVAVAGYKSLNPGQSVHLEWEAGQQDGFSYRALRTWPSGESPALDPLDEANPSQAYTSSLSITFDHESTEQSAD